MRWATLPQQYYDTLQFKQQLAARLILTGQLIPPGSVVTDFGEGRTRCGSSRKNSIFILTAAGKRTIQTLNKQPQDWMLQAAIT